MLWNAKNGCVKIDDIDMDYVSFGHGNKVLIVLPGLSDGLLTVKGKALLLAKPYVDFFKNYTVYMFSRKNEMPDGYSIRDMAADQAKALKELGITKASVMGDSQGGMIGKPRNYDRFFINAKAILEFNAYDELDKIVCPTYIIGGDEDKTVGVNASYEMKNQIKHSELYIYKGLGHAAFEEAKDFYSRVYHFLMK